MSMSTSWKLAVIKTIEGKYDLSLTCVKEIVSTWIVESRAEMQTAVSGVIKVKSS